MSRRVRWMRWSVLAAWLALAGWAGAVAPEIRDEGKYFSPDAIQKANEQLRDLFAKYGKDLLIETFPAVPADQRDKVKAMSPKEKAEFFEKLAIGRAKQRVVNGIYLLINKEPMHWYVAVSPKARAEFGRETYEHIREIVLANFIRENHFDKGLEAMVQTFRDKLEKASPK